MLTEKGTQRIEIIVRKAGGDGLTGAKEKQADDANGSQENQDAKGTKKTKNAIWWRTQLTHSAAVLKQVSTQWFNYAVAGVGYKYGDQALQQQVERQVEQVMDVGNIATSVAMGATYGAAGGPLGSLFGAVMMGAQTTSSTVLKYATRQREYDVKMFKENNAIEYKRARAQINLTTGRLR